MRSAAGERYADVGQIRLCYETFGDPTDETVVLIMGLGLSMLYWPDEFCAELVGRRYQVVRFDNRDIGRSTICTGRGISPSQLLRRRAHPPYTLGDMADDTAGLIAALDAPGAHIIGVSLGAMIAQEVALRHPRLTRSLVSIMGRPGDRRTGRMARSLIPQILLQGVRPTPRSADAAVEDLVRTFRRIGSAGRTDADDADLRVATRASMARERGSGSGRQLAAVVAERNRTGELARLRVPTLVVHGRRDRVVEPSGGHATAAAIPGAELMLVPGMGHDLPRWIWPQLVEGIARTAARARSGASG